MYQDIAVSSIRVNAGRREIDDSVVAQLADSIAQVGLMNPVIVDATHTLIAGAHRLEAYKLLGRTHIPATVSALCGLEAELAEIDENLMRNDLHFVERGEQLARRKAIYEELYPETRNGATGNKGGRIVENEIISFSSDTAEKAGISKRTVEQEIQIAQNLTPEAKAAVREADVSKTDALKLARMKPELQRAVAPHVARGLTVEAARREVKIAESRARIAEIVPDSDNVDIATAQNKYAIIYADPPWGGYFKAGNKNQDNHYPLMTIEQICELPVQRIADDNAVLFLWVTYPILDRAFEVIKAWGFHYSTCAFCWVKQNKNGEGYFFGNGNWTHANTELCLMATKGSVTRLDAAVSQLIVSPVEEHSKKPDETRRLITRLVGEMKRIELFSRQAADGWDAWGLEAGSSG